MRTASRAARSTRSLTCTQKIRPPTTGTAWFGEVLRGGGKTLHRWRLRARRRSRIGFRRLSWSLAGGVGHQANLHAAILGAAFGGLVRLDRLIFAQPDQKDLVGRDVLFRR